MAERKFIEYLLYFAHDHLEFRSAELRSLLDYFKINARVPEFDKFCPFVTIELPCEEDAKKIASRSVLIRSVFECWLTAESLDKLYAGLKELPKDFVDPYLRSKESYRYRLSIFNKKLNSKQILQVIEGIPLLFDGPVDLTNAKERYHVLQDYTSPSGTFIEHPNQVFFGRWIADGQRNIIQEYHLKNRKFIANTSMDAQLSMIIANIAQVGPNMWVHDPFVGSGGLLVAAAHFGSYVSGTDIDYLLLHAKAAPSRTNQVKREEDESIRANLRQYGCERLYLDVMIADASKQGMWRDQPLFDAIVTDPPYGIREGAKRQALDQATQNKSADYISRKEQYNLSDMFKDLLNFAARYLHKNGRLVYWFPVVCKEYTDDNVPSHPCFKLVYNCEQIFNTKVSRRLITMEKVHDLKIGEIEAEMKVDHFGKESFRDRYFTVDNGHKTGVKPVGKIDSGDTTDVKPTCIINASETTGVKAASKIDGCDTCLTTGVKAASKIDGGDTCLTTGVKAASKIDGGDTCLTTGVKAASKIDGGDTCLKTAFKTEHQCELNSRLDEEIKDSQVQGSSQECCDLTLTVQKLHVIDT